MNDLKRILAAVGFGVCLLPGWLGLLCLVFGRAGLLWFMGTWIIIELIGFFIGLIVLPDPKPTR